MSCKTRFVILSVPQHVIQRGHHREPFFYSEKYYFRCLENLYVAAIKNGAVLYVYVLVTNHVH